MIKVVRRADELMVTEEQIVETDDAWLMDPLDAFEVADEVEQAVLQALASESEGLTKKRIRDSILNTKLHGSLDQAITKMLVRRNIYLEEKRYRVAELQTELTISHCKSENQDENCVT